MGKRFGGFKVKEKGWKFALSKESADALLDVLVKIIGENTTGRFARAALIAVASTVVGVVSKEPPSPQQIVAAVQEPAPEPPKPVPPVVAGPPPIPPRDGDIRQVKSAQ